MAMDNQNENDDKKIGAPLSGTDPICCESENENEIVTNNDTRQAKVVKILLATVLVAATLSSGMAMGYSAVLIPQLQSTTSSLHADDEMGSWIASIPAIAGPPGAILGGIMMDCIGRKLTLHIQTGTVAAGWIFICLCQNHGLLLTGRFISGFANGIGMVAGQIYIGEVTDPNMRSVFMIIPVLSYSCGILLVYILGTAIHWRIVAGLGIIPPVVSALMYFFLPESPVWLVRHGHTKEAIKANIWYRGNNIIQGKQEVQQLIDRKENEKSQQSQSTGVSFCTPAILKPLLIVNTFNVFQIFSGWNLLVLYAVEIVSVVVGGSINEYFTAVLTAGVRVIFTIVAVFVSASAGRRPIGIYSGLGTGLSAFCLGLSLYLNYGKSGYFLSICLLFYVAAVTIGFSTLPSIMIGEMFPARARAAVGTITIVFTNSLLFVFAKLYPSLKNLLGMHGLFLMFGVSSFLASTVIYCTLPETKGKTLNEIEDYFLQDNILWASHNKQCKNLRPSNNVVSTL